MLSYDVASLFTNVALEETIHLLADKAFLNDCFNETHHALIDYINRAMALPWAPRWVPCWLMSPHTTNPRWQQITGDKVNHYARQNISDCLL